MEKFPSSPGSRPTLSAVNLRKVLPQEFNRGWVLPTWLPALQKRVSVRCCLPGDSAKPVTSGKRGVSICFKLKACGEGLCCRRTAQPGVYVLRWISAGGVRTPWGVLHQKRPSSFSSWLSLCSGPLQPFQMCSGKSYARRWEFRDPVASWTQQLLHQAMRKWGKPFMAARLPWKVTRASWWTSTDVVHLLVCGRFKKYKQAGSHSNSFRLSNGRTDDAGEARVGATRGAKRSFVPLFLLTEGISLLQIKTGQCKRSSE